ncbi:hypothetical protein KUV57_13125 [Epibacterium sp. DP7N7-1]|nr:hypothetical protein [Epibacterium sp. DP7N7-1]
MTSESNQMSGALPETVVTALISASDEIAQRETWAAPRRGGAAAAVPRIISIIMAAQGMLRPSSSVRAYVRQNSLRVLAYLPADLRLGALIDMASRNPEALDDLFSGKISKEFDVYRYNVISTLSVFARHGLIEEVFTRENIEAVGQSVQSVRRRAVTDARKGE